MINPYRFIKEIGFERMAGTEGEKKAAAIILKHLDKMDLKVKKEPFEMFSYKPGSAKLKIKDREFDLIPYGLNEDADLEGELIYLDNIDALKLNLGAYENKIVISYGYSRELQETLKKGKVKAFISIGMPQKKTGIRSHRQNSYKNGYTNCVSVSHDLGEKIVKYNGKKVKLIIRQEVFKTEAFNIVVDIPGENPDNNLILISAHYDTVAHCAGSSDNGGGTVTLLKAAEYFSRHRPQRDLRLIFFSGEEMGLLGSQAYVNEHKMELQERSVFLVNVDVSGDPVGFDTAFVIGTKELLGYFNGISREQGLAFNSNLSIYSSDGMPFAVYEIPSISLSRRGGKANFFIHTPDDNPRYVNNQGYKNTIKAAITILNRVLNAKIFPIKREIDPDLKPKIEKYLWSLNFEKPKMYWQPIYQK